MARNNSRAAGGKITLDEVQIRAADATDSHLYENFAWAWVGGLTFDEA